MKDFLRVPAKMKSLIPRLIILCSLTCSTVWAVPHASFTVDKSSGCSPLNVQFSNTSTGAVSYYWDFGNGNTSTLQSPSNLYTIAGSYTVVLVATDASGNKDTLIANNSITVAAMPTADFNSPSPNSCLDNNSIAFISTSTGAVSWLWDFGDGTFSSLQNPVHTYVSSGIYTIVLMVANSSGCTDVKTLNHYITIYQKPVASFSVSTTVACSTSDPVSFTSTSTGAASYQWNFGDGQTSSLQNPVYYYASPGTFTPGLIVTDINGCTDTSNSLINIYVKSSNWGWFNSDIDFGCAPLTVKFQCLVPAAAITSVSWNFGDGGSSTLTNPSHIYSSGGKYAVTMNVTDTNGCTSTLTAPDFIIAGAYPTVDFTLSDTTGCSPLAVQFNSNCVNASAYQWSFGDGTPDDSDQNAVHTYVSTGNYTVTLMCTGTPGCTKQLIKDNAIHVSADIANFSGWPRTSCPPMTVNFTNFSQGNKLSCFWKFGDGSVSTQMNPSHIYTNGGVYDVTLIIKDSTGCSDTLFKPAYIQVNDPASTYVTPDTTITCAPLTTQFQDNTAGAMSWLWDFGDGTTSTLQNPYHTYPNPGIYTVSLTTQLSGGCSQAIKAFRVFDLKGGVAKFSVQHTACPPYCASFTDSSINAVSWLWNFGDGATSTQQNPSHCYGAAGFYSVSLTITTSDGCTVSTMYSNCVYFPPFQANFYGVPVNSGSPQTIDFYANSVGATGWQWSFGDGGTSTDENPVHTYLSPGQYQVTLTITSGPCTLTYSPPAFSSGSGDTLQFNPVVNVPLQPQEGCAPFFVTFNNNNPANVSWLWDFGDGTSDSSANTYHTYYNAGIFTVRLTTVDTSGNKNITVMDSLVRVSDPVAKFSYSQGNSCNNTLITFIDSSVNANQYWWSFGDGSTDTSKSPTHLFAGTNTNYIVSLTVTDTTGCANSLSTSIFSSIINPVAVDHPNICNNKDTVRFSTNLQNYASYKWLFGDGDLSSIVAPWHLYLSPGVYSVTLTVTDNSGCSQTFNLNTAITVNAPIAQFSTNDSLNSCNASTIHFNSLSTGADYYQWDFGDTTGSNSAAPIHEYDNPGNYNVTLTAFNGSCSSTIVKTNYVNVYKAHADFSTLMHGVCLPMTFQFTDLSTNAVSWHWGFGDDSVSSLQSPAHTFFTKPYTFTRLTIIDSHGCKDSTWAGPFHSLSDQFIVSSDTGCLPLTVSFTGQCDMAVSYSWNFGDGTFSTQPDPQHIYTDPGSYDVTLIASSAYNCSDTLTIPRMITVLNPHADFLSSDRSACAPAVINFTNLSNDATSWVWDFGDGTTSTNKNPSHIYNVPGVYDIKLIVGARQGCSDTIIKPKYITVTGTVSSFTVSATSGCNSLTVQFTDYSINAITWAWSFGDGYASSEENPIHSYKDTGSFIAVLVTYDSTGCSSYYSYPQKIVVHSNPQSGFFTNDTIGCQPFAVTLNNTSTGADLTRWDFGDGTISEDIDPTHIYSNQGSYVITLISSTQFGCADTFRLNYPIRVNMTPLVHFSAGTTSGCRPLTVSFSDSSSNLLNPVYSWNFGNGQTSNIPSPKATFTNSGFYSISLSINNSSGCGDSLSMTDFINTFDTVPPSVSPIYSVSVVSNTSVEITWENNSAHNLGAYELFRYNPVTLIWDNIYTNNNPANADSALTSSYADEGLNTLQNTYSYKLLTTDVCRNAIGLDQLTANTTINVSAKPSGNGIKVYWTPYEGATISNYTIYRTAPGSHQQYIASVPPDSLSYIDTAFRCPLNYSFQVKANDLDGRPYTSNSDTADANPVNIFANRQVEIVKTTIVDNTFVLTEWKQPAIHPESVVQYELYRSTDNENFLHITSLPSLQTDYADYTVDVQSNTYYYRVLVKNECDINENFSDVSSSILLSGEVSDDYVYRLHWTNYQHWASGVDDYVIEKQNADGSWTAVGKVAGTTIQFEDH